MIKGATHLSELAAVKRKKSAAAAKQVVTLTGLSEKEFAGQIKDIKHHQLEGVEYSGKLRRCYLCKRAEGDQSVAIKVDGTGFVYPTITIRELEISAVDVMTFRYPLCQECLVLISGAAKTFAESEDRSGKSNR